MPMQRVLGVPFLDNSGMRDATDRILRDRVGTCLPNCDEPRRKVSGRQRQAVPIAEEMLDILLADRPASGKVSVMVNRCDATLPEELFIRYRIVTQRLEAAGEDIVLPLVGRCATSMEIAGAAIARGHPGNNPEAWLKARCDCAFWTVRQADPRHPCRRPGRIFAKTSKGLDGPGMVAFRRVPGG